jgi:lipoprotein NlpI
MTKKDVEIYYNQAIKSLENGEVKKSLELLNMVLNIDKKYLPAWNDKGVVLLELKEYQQALDCFEHLIRLDPSDNMPWYNKGYVLMLLEEYTESVQSFDIFLARYPKKDDFYKFALYLRAQGLYSLKKYEKAHESLKKALDMDKTFKEARELLVVVSGEMEKNK